MRLLSIVAVYLLTRDWLPERVGKWSPYFTTILAVLVVLVILTRDWMPLGIQLGFFRNLAFIFTLIATLLGSFLLFMRYYEPILRFFLRHKPLFYAFPAGSVLLGIVAWLGFSTVFGVIPWSASKVGLSSICQFVKPSVLRAIVK